MGNISREAARFALIAYISGNRESSSFASCMVRAVIVADTANREQIRGGFPELVEEYEEAWKDHSAYLAKHCSL